MTRVTPMMPPAPVVFSTIDRLVQEFAHPRRKMRPMTSNVPPAA